MKDTISAISTPLAASGVAIIRVSGEESKQIAKKVFKSFDKSLKDFEPNKMYVGEISCGDFSDVGMIVYFKGPKSFTGEDTIELHCHGGVAIAKAVFKQTLKCGARPAGAGEFTKRAFINGKLSLSSCEGLIDMINSQSEGSARAGAYLYREKLTKKVNAMQQILTDVLAEIDADMDFPEEDLEKTSVENVKVLIKDVLEKTNALLSTFNSGRVVLSGVKVGIIGKPNTGKSSLLNALLSYEKAIVSDVAGTTRDIVEGSLDLDGVRFNFLDTAGIRDAVDQIENLGVMLSKRVLGESDLILFVVDGSDLQEEDQKIYELVKDKNAIVVQNKQDRCDKKWPKADIIISATTGEGIEELKDLMKEKSSSSIDFSSDFLCEERHFDALTRVKEKLESALSSIDLVTADLLSIDVKLAWDALGEITGVTASEKIIDNIFSKFCVGK